jgi:NAD(P)-dependent dehydrogenase (short-subunit alcohol dehydrogenase family)
MNNKRILITGGNSGIGIVTATELARQGAEIVLACRDSEKTARALEQINAVAKIPAVNLPVDLASFASVRAMAAEVLARYDRLDVLINNAGLFPPKQQHTDDGYEMQIGVNHLAHFLLTNLLLDLLQRSAPARVISVSSMLHKKASIDFDSFKGETRYNAQTAYGQSKLANVLFAVELAERLTGTGVTSNVLHPGAVATDIVRDTPWLIRKMIGLMFIAPEKGAKTTLQLATDPELAQTTGKYFNQCKEEDCSPLANDRALREKLWQVSAEATGV